MWGYLFQHISSRRHKDRVAGKPMKPKYSPYNKLQRSPSILAVSISISYHCLCEFVTLGTPTTQRKECDWPDASAAFLPLQAESAQGSDLKIVMHSVCPVKGTQTALRVLFTARKRIISGTGNEPLWPRGNVLALLGYCTASWRLQCVYSVFLGTWDNSQLWWMQSGKRT